MVLEYGAYQWVIAQALLRLKSRAAFWICLTLAILPLAFSKYVPIFSPQTNFGFFGISYVSFRALPQVADAVVLVAEKGGKPDSLAGFVVLRERGEGSDFDVSLQLKKQLADRLPNYMVPRKFHFLPAFPMTTNGKADRRKLAEMLG